MVERGNRSGKAQIRAVLFVLEAHLDALLDIKHPLMYWLVLHSGYICSHYFVGQDGRTCYEKLKGKPNRAIVCEFGEQVHFMPLKTDAVSGSMSKRYLTGVWLGIDERTSETRIGCKDGTVTGSRSIVRLPEDERWDKEFLEKVKGTPWNLSGDDEELPAATFASRPEADPAVAPMPVPPPEGAVPRRLRIGRKDLDEYGFSVGCQGCDASKAGTAPRAHTEACRERLMEALRNTDDGKKRIGEAISRIFEHLTNAAQLE